MVDVSDKGETDRTATAQAVIRMQQDTFRKILDNTGKKGNVLETARIAGIMGAKRTGDLIPMCHPLMLTSVRVDFLPHTTDPTFTVVASVRTKGRTGVEMEALTAVSVAALTIYDMCKSYDRTMTISDICLMEKSGGKSGDFVREAL